MLFNGSPTSLLVREPGNPKMSSYYDDSKPGIGPTDVDPNPEPPVKPTPVRTPSLFAMTVDQFLTIRSDFVAKFKDWREGTSGKTPAQIAEILEYMEDDLDHFKTAMIPNVTRACFPIKCGLIKHEILALIERLKGSTELGLETEEYMAYIASAIRRLALLDEDDDEAWLETHRFILRIHPRHVWDMPEMGFTPEAEALRVRLWTVYTNLNHSMAGCGCYQCKVVFDRAAPKSSSGNDK